MAKENKFRTADGDDVFNLSTNFSPDYQVVPTISWSIEMSHVPRRRRNGHEAAAEARREMLTTEQFRLHLTNTNN